MSMGRFLVLVFAAVSFIVGVPRILGEFREDLARWSSMLAEWQWWNFALVATSLACAGYVLWPIISRLSGINRGGPHPLDSSAAKLRWIPGSCF